MLGDMNENRRVYKVHLQTGQAHWRRADLLVGYQTQQWAMLDFGLAIIIRKWQLQILKPRRVAPQFRRRSITIPSDNGHVSRSDLVVVCLVPTSTD